MEIYNKILRFIVMATLLLSLAQIAYGAATQPTNPNVLTVDSSSKFNVSNWPSKSISAEAGNISKLTVSGVSPTQTWQGYYGDVTGTITLDDAANNTLYDWSTTEPQGEIYATTQSAAPDWTTIHCVNYTAVGGNGSSTGGNHTYTYDGGTQSTVSFNNTNLTILELRFNINPDDVDGIDETFNNTGKVTSSGITRDTIHSEFQVGSINVTRGSCPAVDLYESDSATGTNFQEVLLTWNNTNQVIFAAVIENDVIGNDTDVVGFHSSATDFEMLVLEDGHLGEDLLTTYYFYVEIQ